jgi:hypothetical protein
LQDNDQQVHCSGLLPRATGSSHIRQIQVQTRYNSPWLPPTRCMSRRGTNSLWIDKTAGSGTKLSRPDRETHRMRTLKDRVLVQSSLSRTEPLPASAKCHTNRVSALCNHFGQRSTSLPAATRHTGP